MSEEDIDLDRVVIDPAYRRRVIRFLNELYGDADRRAPEPGRAGMPSREPEPAGAAG